MWRLRRSDVSYSRRQDPPVKEPRGSPFSLLEGNEEFYLIDDQKLVFETAKLLAEISTSEKKNVLIVKGGPGTGKSVVAINLLVKLTKRELVGQHFTKNSAPSEVYQSKLSGTLTKTRISNLFKGSGAYTETEANTWQGLEVDYVGVIFGYDFLARSGKIVTDAAKRHHGDRSIHGYKQALKANRSEALERADAIIKNTYRTLMTRGQEGCHAYSLDPETNA